MIFAAIMIAFTGGMGIGAYLMHGYMKGKRS